MHYNAQYREVTCFVQVELKLQKQDTRSWNLLEKSNRDLGNINLTFGVGGRTGTIGAKQPVLDANNGQV